MSLDCSDDQDVATEWSTPKLEQVRIGLKKIVSVLGYYDTVRVTYGGVLYVMVHPDTTWPGLYCPEGKCPTRIDPTYEFMGFKYAIGLRNWDDALYKEGELDKAFTVVHEYGHRANDIANAKGNRSYETDIWNTFWNDGKGTKPTGYCDSAGEYFAETFALFMWAKTEGDTYYSMTPEEIAARVPVRHLNHRRKFVVNLKTIFGKTDKGTESLYDYFERKIISVLKR